MAGGRANAERDELMRLDPTGAAWNNFNSLRVTRKTQGMSASEAKAAAFNEITTALAGREKATGAAPGSAAPKVGGVLPASAFGKRDCDTGKVVRWVAEHISVDTDPSEAPSATAWALLQWARQPVNLQTFWGSMWAKLMPSKSQVDEEADALEDDQLESDVVYFTEARRNAALRASAERSGRERVLPGGTLDGSQAQQGGAA